MKSSYKIAILMVLAVVARLAFLGTRPLDGDEGVVIKIADSANLAELFEAVSRDVHPPLYHFLQFVFQKVLPAEEFYLRFLPALLAIATIYLVFILFRHIFNQKIAFAVALLAIFSPLLSYSGAEVRPYPLLTLLFFTSLIFLVRIQKQDKTSDWVWFGIIALLMALTQYVGFIIFAAELIYLLMVRRKSALKLILTTGGVVAVFYLIWGGNFISQVAGRLGEQSQAINLKENAVGLFNFIYRLGAGRLFLDINPSLSGQISFFHANPFLYLIFLLSLLVPLALLAIGLNNYFKDRKLSKMPVAICGMIILVACFSGEIGPKMVRYLSFLAPIYVFLVYLSLQSKGYVVRVLFWIFIAIYLGAFVNGLYFERKKPGVREIAQYLDINAKKDDKVLVKGGFGAGESYVLRYYLAELERYQIIDFYGDYAAGNLSLLRTKSNAQFIEENQGAATLWFYDLTYGREDFGGLKVNEKTVLGKDKEGKELILYRF